MAVEENTRPLVLVLRIWYFLTSLDRDRERERKKGRNEEIRYDVKYVRCALSAAAAAAAAGFCCDDDESCCCFCSFSCSGLAALDAAAPAG